MSLQTFYLSLFTLQYGLIAEEVAAVDPGLVHADLDRRAALIAQQSAELTAQRREIAALAARLAKLEAAAPAR